MTDGKPCTHPMPWILAASTSAFTEHRCRLCGATWRVDRSDEERRRLEPGFLEMAFDEEERRDGDDASDSVFYKTDTT